MTSVAAAAAAGPASYTARRSGTPAPALFQLRAGPQQVLYARHAALGAVRRILAGEMNPAPVKTATRNIQTAQRLRAEARPLVERMARTAPAAYRPWVEAIQRLDAQAEPLIMHAAHVARAAERLALPSPAAVAGGERRVASRAPPSPSACARLPAPSTRFSKLGNPLAPPFWTTS